MSKSGACPWRLVSTDANTLHGDDGAPEQHGCFFRIPGLGPESGVLWVLLLPI
jgi:hypothetical protein